MPVCPAVTHIVCNKPLDIERDREILIPVKINGNGHNKGTCTLSAQVSGTMRVKIPYHGLNSIPGHSVD